MGKRYLWIGLIIALFFGGSTAMGALTQYGLPGIYNTSNFTLTNGQGSGIAVDSQGRMQISTSSALSSLTVNNFTATTATISNLSFTSLTSSPIKFTSTSPITAANYEIGRSSTGLFVNVPTSASTTFYLNGAQTFSIDGRGKISHNMSTLTGGDIGLDLVYTTTNTGSAGASVIGFRTYSDGTFTGSTGTFLDGMVSDISVPSIGATFATDATYGYRPAGRNSGYTSFTRGTTAGYNYGGVFLARGGNQNVGVWGSASVTKASTPNIGIFGTGFNNNTDDSTRPQIGGFFTLSNSGAVPVWGSSAALVADNLATNANIFSARDNTVPVFAISDGGSVTSTVATLTSATPFERAFMLTQVLNASAGTGGTDNYYGMLLNYTTTDVSGFDGEVNGLTIRDDGNEIYGMRLNGAFTIGETTAGAITHTARTSDATVNNLTISAQNAFYTAAINQDGGNLIFRSASSSLGGGVDGSLFWQTPEGNELWEFSSGGQLNRLNNSGTAEGETKRNNNLVRTTNGATTTVATINTDTDITYTLAVQASAIKDDGVAQAGYALYSVFQNDGGVLTGVGSTTTAHSYEVNTGLNLIFSSSGTNILIQAVGLDATNIDWLVDSTITAITLL